MSFIPGEGTEIASIASINGSGISITNIADVDYIATNLVAGTNITLVPNPSNTSITINASAGGGGIASVSSANGSGIEATTVGTGVNLTSALVAGTGISLVPSGVNKNLTINNTQSITSAIGSGINATTVGGTTSLEANLVAGNGIQISLSGANTSKQINNIGVLNLTSANSGISINQPAGAVQLTNNGVLELTAGSGIAISGTKANYTISATNDGDVLSVSSGGAGISITGTAQNPVVNNTGVVAINGGTGISVSSATGSPTIALQNAGTAGTYTHPTSFTTDAQGRVVSATSGSTPVASVGAGTGITLTGTATAPVVNLTNVGSAGTYANPSSITTNAQGQITNIVAGSPVSGFGRNYQQVFSPGTNLWTTGVNVFHTIDTFMPSPFFYSVSGIVFNSAGLPYAGGSYPPASYNIQWACPVSTASTPNSPGTDWYKGIIYTNPTNPQYNLTIQGRLVNRNYGTGVLNAVLDEATCQAGVYVDSITNTPYLLFNITFVATQSSPAGSGAGNDNNLGFEFAMAGFPTVPSPADKYSFNPSGNVSAIEYCKVSASFTS